MQDAKNPTHEELAALLQAEYEKSDPLDGVTDEMERFAQQYGAAEIDFAPLITGFDIFTKGDSGSAAVYLENPDAAVLEPVHDAQSLSVVGGEGVEWYLDPAQAGEGIHGRHRGRRAFLKTERHCPEESGLKRMATASARILKRTADFLCNFRVTAPLFRVTIQAEVS